MAANYQISPRKVAENKVSRASISTWLVVIITLVYAAISYFGNSDSFSGLSVFATSFAFMFYRTALLNIWIPVAVTVVLCVVFAVCAVFGKKHPAALYAAAVLWGLDMIFMAVCLLTGFVTSDSGFSSLIGVVFHAWILYDIISGIIAMKKLKTMPEDEEPKQYVPFRENYDSPAPAERSDDGSVKAPQEKKIPSETPLYAYDGQGEVRFDISASGCHIIAVRKFGLTELIIDGQVYDKYDRIIEEAYTLSAKISVGDAQTVVVYNQNSDGEAVLSVNGEKLKEAKFSV